MDSIRSKVERIADLSNDELSELRGEVVETFETLNEAELSAETVAQMTELADIATAITSETSRRDAELAELNLAAQAAAEVVLSEDSVDSVEGEESDVVDEPVEEVVVEVEDVEEFSTATEDLVEDTVTASAEENIENTNDVSEVETETEETVTASADLVIEVPSENEPVFTPAEDVNPTVITAGADIVGVAAGSVLPNLRSVAQALLDRRKSMGRTSGGDGEQHTVAVFSTSFPDSRRLYSDDQDGNSSKIADIVSPAAIVAAGGICAPVEAKYDVYGLGERGRPVRDSLAVFGADRGGIRFTTPPALADLNGSVSLWTLQDDIDAGTPGAPDPIKPCIRVVCGAEVTVYTDAIPLCLTFGNLGARAYPELNERHLELGMVWHDRFAETRLLTRIGTLSTAVTTAAELGSARDFFVAVDQAAAGYRSRNRLSIDTPLRIILPEWFQAALRADLTKQIPGDGVEAGIALAQATINDWFAVRNINVTWSLDGETGQILGAQAAGALNEFPASVVWYLFSEGTFLFLDGGTLDLGLVRDSTLNGTNDYKVFLETFEGVAKVGLESLKVTSPVNLWGATAATVDTTV